MFTCNVLRLPDFAKHKISRTLWRKLLWSFNDNYSDNDSDLAISNAKFYFLFLMVKTYALI